MGITAYATSGIDADTIAAGVAVLQDGDKFAKNADENGGFLLEGVTGYAPGEAIGIALHVGGNPVNMTLEAGTPAADQIREALKVQQPGSAPVPGGPDIG